MPFLQHMVKMKLLFLGLFLSFSLHGQVQTTPIKELDHKMKTHPQKVLILLSTDWCAYCEVSKKLMRNGQVLIRTNQSFYYVEFDAETTDPILFNGYEFKPTSKSKTHPLALALNENKKNIAYPLWVILNEKYEIIYSKPGFLKPKQLQQLIDALD